MRILSIAALQTAPVARDPAATLERLASRLPAVRDVVPGVNLIVLPEFHLSALPSLLDESADYAEEVAVELPGALSERLGEIAREAGAWLVAGSVYERGADGRIHNTVPVLSPTGELVATYRKIFPWQPHESSVPGDRFVTFEIPDIGRIGLAVCYDGNFPEMFRQLAWLGAEVVIQPTLTTTSQRDRQPALRREPQRRGSNRAGPQPDRRPGGPRARAGRRVGGASHRRPRSRRRHPCAGAGNRTRLADVGADPATGPGDRAADVRRSLGQASTGSLSDAVPAAGAARPYHPGDAPLGNTLARELTEEPMTSTQSKPELSVSSTEELRSRARGALENCGIDLSSLGSGPSVSARSPITGEELFHVSGAGPAEVEEAIAATKDAFREWRDVPAPLRGAFVKRLGELLSRHKEDVAELVTIEAGKITSESLGEVQEAIDICDFAVGLSRQLDGRTMPSERPGHRLMETWHPLGVVGVITAFNFPCAVWAWNAAIAFVCGDTIVWKPSPMTPLTSMACQSLVERAASECDAPAAVQRLVIADTDGGQVLVDSPDVALISATGSERMGTEVAPRVAARMGKYLLELGGNNAAVVAPSADLELARRGIVFAAAGTAGQRCTTLRRVIAHDDIDDELITGLRDVFGRLPIGDPSDDGTLVGPLINERAYQGMVAALEEAQSDGGELVVGGDRREVDGLPNAYYVEPAIVRMPGQTELVRRETFAPILYVMTYGDFEEAIA